MISEVRTHLLEASEVASRIRRGDALLLAGDEEVLRSLPRGRWIGGTNCYFVGEEGGVVDHRHVYTNALPEGFECVAVRRYDAERISRVYADLPAHGMGAIVVPYGSRSHLSFALNAPRYEGFARLPLFGWVAGVHLEAPPEVKPRVFDGITGEALEEEAVVMQIAVPAAKVVDLGIINVFEKGDGPAITFPASGFTVREAAIDGRVLPFAEYIGETGLDTRLPLVADYLGARVNVSFRRVDPASGAVRLFAPVFAGVVYHHARPVPDFVDAFAAMRPPGLRAALSCSCILNFVHSGLEGRGAGLPAGPATFGEIAYQLLNQTTVYVTISDAR